MQVVSIINYKGGVGKTTITANLAAELAFRGYNILAIDLDPQASLTFSFVSVDEWREKYEKSVTIKNWYDAFIDEDSDLDLSSLIIRPQTVNRDIKKGKVDLICSHLALINVDLELATRLSGASQRQVRNNYLRVYSRLKQGLSTLEEGKYNFVLIDCPPNFNIVTKNALVASNSYLVPAKPDYLSTLGIEQLRRHVSELVKDYNHYVDETNNLQWEKISPLMLGVLFTMITIRNQSAISAQKQYIEQVKGLNIPIIQTSIRENNTIYAEAPEYGVPVVLQRVSGKTYKEIQDELEKLTTEFLNITNEK
ncbi:MAG: ParA family protein [Candidatus Omnitrophota bacterium]|jgi:chromosome partitioning protein|nr:MAG: ParA family protein [Candidatus Omnitrophota bacterium]